MTIARAFRGLPAALAFVIVSCLAVGPASAQSTGTIAGRVTTSAGGLLTDATVTVWNQTIAVERRTTTNADGIFELAELPVQGIYTLRVELAGFGTLVQSGISLLDNQRLSIDFVLRASSAESLVVTGRLPALEVERSAVQQVVGETLTHTLPLVGRDFIALASLTPGFSGSPNLPSAQGQQHWSNNVLVDGASHYSKWRGAARTFYSGYGLESIREVQVLSSQYSAEFGETLATVTSALTNSGTNERHGSALLFVQNDAFNDVPAFTSVTPPSDSERFGVTHGGPLLQDRTHYFGSYEGRRARTKNIVLSPVAPGALAPSKEDEHLFFFKIDHKPRQRSLLTVRYNGQWFGWHNEPGGLRVPGSGEHYSNDVHTFLVSHTTLLSNALLNQIRVQFARYRDIRTDLQPTLYVVRHGYSVEGGIQGPFGTGADPEDTWEVADTLSYKRGRHSYKAGGGLKHVSSTNPELAFGHGAYYFSADPVSSPQPFAFVQRLAGSRDATTAAPRSLAGFGFVQDDWRAADNLTLNLGLRYDIDRIANVLGYAAATDINNLQPRLGVAWSPIDERVVVRGGVGLYTQQHLLHPINRVQLEGVSGAAAITLTPESPLMPTFPNLLSPAALSALPRDIHVLAPSFRNPWSIQTTAGVEQSVSGVLFSADYVYLRGRDLLSVVDTNAPVSLSGAAATRTVAAADLTRPVVPVPGGFRKIIALGNEGESWYRGLHLRTAQSTGPLQTIVAYALAKAEDRANYLLPEDSRNLDAEKGASDNDIRHNVSIGFIFKLPSGNLRALTGWSLSGISQFRTARPYTITWGDDRNGTSQNDARPEGRNTARGDTYSTVDVSLSRQFRPARRIIEVRAEAFNILSTVNYDEYVGTLSSASFSRPVSAWPRRRMQFAAIYRF